jgi:cytosine/adenosine deaminase-related metal-dependent hydrolase
MSSRNLTPMPGAPTIVEFRAGAAVDATGWAAAPASLLVRVDPGTALSGDGSSRSALDGSPFTEGLPGFCNARLLASGSPEQVALHPLAAGARVVDRPEHVLLPAFVNAHSHLDLTHVGPLAHDPDAPFASWIPRVTAARHPEGDAIGASVRLGAALSLAGGVVAVGDIAGATRLGPRPEPGRALGESGLMGVSYVEFFALGADADERVMAAFEVVKSLGGGGLARANTRLRFGLSPHAPYSVLPKAYARAAALASEHALPLCTHLAESLDERRAIVDAEGPFVDFLRALGRWDDATRAAFARHPSPTRHLAEFLRDTRPLSGAEPSQPRSTGLSLVHVNDLSDGDVELLVESRAGVVYCPRASAYFGAPGRLGPHRYRELLRRGVLVALGTDSIINLDTPDRLSTLDEARLLWRRDGAASAVGTSRDARANDPADQPISALELLAMFTTSGAAFLGLAPSAFTLTNPVASSNPSRALAGLVGVRVQDALNRRPQGPHEVPFAETVARIVLESAAKPELFLFGSA